MIEQGPPNGLGRLGQRFWYVGDRIVIGLLFAYITYVHSRFLICYSGGLHHNGAPWFAGGIFLGLYLDTSHRPVVRLAWGGFDEDYGIAIGSVDMKVFKTLLTQEEATEANVFYEYADYIRPLAPGAYVWYDVY